eukprot:COSAG01_NODE_302_length_19206_cov_11.098687_15_plen_174_part_00
MDCMCPRMLRSWESSSVFWILAAASFGGALPCAAAGAPTGTSRTTTRGCCWACAAGLRTRDACTHHTHRNAPSPCRLGPRIHMRRRPGSAAPSGGPAGGACHLTAHSAVVHLATGLAASATGAPLPGSCWLLSHCTECRQAAAACSGSNTSDGLADLLQKASSGQPRYERAPG